MCLCIILKTEQKHGFDGMVTSPRLQIIHSPNHPRDVENKNISLLVMSLIILKYNKLKKIYIIIVVYVYGLVQNYCIYLILFNNLQ